MVGNRFSELLYRRDVSFTCAGALRALILSVCDYLLEMPTTPCGNHSLPPSMQSTMIAIVRNHLMQGLRHNHAEALAQWPARGELIASAAAWSIYGAASEWVTTPARLPAEEIVADIANLIVPIMETVSK